MPANRDKLEQKVPPPEVSAQLAAPIENHLADDDYTGQHRALPEATRDRDRLRELRRSRTPSERMDRLEDKHDDVVADVGTIKVDIGVIKTSLGSMAVSFDRMAKRDDAAAAVEADIAKAKAIDENKAEIRDELDKRKVRRKFFERIAAGIALGGGGWLLHEIAQALGWIK